MKIPYIQIKQRGEHFFCSKMTVRELKKHISFEFRDPYAPDSPQNNEDFSQYMDILRRKGIELKSSPEGIQRRLQIERIYEIRDFIISDNTRFFANSILLSADVSHYDSFEQDYIKYEQQEVGYFNFPDDLKFMIIDGQHRLGGLIACQNETVDSFEMPIVLLFNVSRSTAARLFSDINGKQKPVNRSLIYDLFGEMNNEGIAEWKALHEICQQFYRDPKSPLYQQIKMLGTGNGAISQAFFIDYTRAALLKAKILDRDTQWIYNQLFYHYRAFQTVFPEDWPVPLKFQNDAEVEQYAERVLKIRRSQLVKTNGFGAITKLFPLVWLGSNETFQGYVEIISQLKGRISWIPNEGEVPGTGKGYQNEIYQRMVDILF